MRNPLEEILWYDQCLGFEQEDIICAKEDIQHKIVELRQVEILNPIEATKTIPKFHPDYPLGCNEFTYKEAIRSDAAKRKNIDNTPTEDHLENLEYIGKNLFCKVRNYFGVPIFISSAYRSLALNKDIGGAFKIINGVYVPKSQHCLGQALDLDADVFNGITNKQIFYFIKDHLDFDQLIWEFGTENNPAWVHVSMIDEKKVKRRNRKSVLRAVKVDNNGDGELETNYIKFDLD